MIQVRAKDVFHPEQRASVLNDALEARVREIADENAMTFSQIVYQALKCFVICYDKPLEPKP